MKKVKLIEEQAINSLISAAFAEVPYSGADCDWGVAREPSLGVVDPYTGNLSFKTQDLSLAGSVGRYGLTWSRVATSRESGHKSFFGKGHNWVHNWQWDLEISREEATASVREPSGTVYQFAQDASGTWASISPAISHKLATEDEGFVLRLMDGARVRFAPSQEAGRFIPTELSDAQSNRWTLSYDEVGLLTQVTEPAGRALTIYYETLVSPASNTEWLVISQVAGSDGQQVTYHYTFSTDADYPLLSAATYPDDTEARYTYIAARAEDRPLLASAYDPHADLNIRGRLFVYRTEADAACGQIHEIRTLDGESLFYRLEAAPESTPEDRRYAITLDNGAVTYHAYNPGGNLAETIDGNGDIVKIEYADEGRGLRIAETNELGDVTTFEHDTNGRLVKTTFPDGTTQTQVWDEQGHLVSKADELGNTATFSYDDKGRLIGLRQPDGTTAEAAYNDLGQVTRYTKPDAALTQLNYDERGLLLQATNPLGGVTTYAYDSHDRLASVTKERGNTTRYERDKLGRTTRIIHPDGAQVTIEYNDFGQVLRTVDETGVEEYINYDELGRQIERGRNKVAEVRSDYAPIGTLAPSGQPIKQTSAMGRTVALEYDPKGQLIARTTAAETAASTTTRMTYDGAGRLISKTDAAGKTIRYDYDSRGRRIQVTTALNHTTQTVYDAAGNKLSKTDPAGNVTGWSYDALGRELTKTDASGQTTTRDYDAAGRLIALTDAKGNVHRVEYDLMGNQTALVYPDGSRESFAYECSGLKLSFTNRSGATESFTYDKRDREITSDWNDGTQSITKEYDAAGRLTLADNGVSKLSFSYDASGRLVSQTQAISDVVSNGAFAPEVRTVTYGYNEDGERTTLGYPDGSGVKYDYEAHGWLSQIFDEGNESPLASYNYDLVGNRTQTPRSNTIITTNAFDEEDRLTSIIDAAANQEPLSQLSYQYNEVGNRTASDQLLHPAESDSKHTQENYRYDAIYQVTGSESEQNAPLYQISSSAQFSYDALGNRKTFDKNGENTNYASNALNQYTQVGGFAPSYDANGNLAEIDGWRYQYDALNRLIAASNEKLTTRFWYDAHNRVVARSTQTTDSDSPTLTLNTYDDWNLIEERDETGTQIARYVHGPRIDEIVVIKNAHGVFYPHHDALGSVTMLTDENGKLAEYYRYSVTGEVTIYAPNGTVLSRSAVGNRWLFTGREWLPELSLYDYRNRIYSPQLGRFLQTDPIRFAANDLNLYRYVKNNYPNHLDPSGKGILSWISGFFGGLYKLLIGWFYIFDFGPDKDWDLGSCHTIIPPGSLQGMFLESFLPVGHLFAQSHDKFIDDHTGYPFWLINIPTMIPIYIHTLLNQVVDTLEFFLEWLTGNH